MFSVCILPETLSILHSEEPTLSPLLCSTFGARAPRLLPQLSTPPMKAMRVGMRASLPLEALSFCFHRCADARRCRAVAGGQLPERNRVNWTNGCVRAPAWPRTLNTQPVNTQPWKETHDHGVHMTVAAGGRGAEAIDARFELQTCCRHV